MRVCELLHGSSKNLLTVQDDCWEEKQPPRDPTTGELRGDSVRFKSGMKALGDYVHAAGLQFAMYTAESSETCGGYPASANNEVLDAKTFASWGVDYLKVRPRSFFLISPHRPLTVIGLRRVCVTSTVPSVLAVARTSVQVDGCGDNAYYPAGYSAMGAALEASGRDIVYSCSWPAYIGSNESEKPFTTFIMDGCNLWRNWDDIQCNFNSLGSIIDHWGDWGSVLAPFAGWSYAHTSRSTRRQPHPTPFPSRRPPPLRCTPVPPFIRALYRPWTLARSG